MAAGSAVSMLGLVSCANIGIVLVDVDNLICKAGHTDSVLKREDGVIITLLLLVCALLSIFVHSHITTIPARPFRCVGFSLDV